MLGSIYRDMDNGPKAVRSYLEALELADTTSNECNYSMLSKIQGQLATLYNANGMYVKALDADSMASIYAKKGSSEIWSDDDAISLHNISKTAVTGIQICSWFFPCPLHLRYIWLRERKPNEGRTKDERRSNGELTETYRTSNENRTENASVKSQRKDSTSAKDILHIMVENGT